MSDYGPNYVPKKTYAHIGVKAILLNKDNKILTLQRSEKAGAGGKWSLPGGGLDFGEEPIQAISREIKEETQLEVIDLQVFTFRSYIHGNDHIVIIGFSCKANTVIVTLNWEHDSYKWLTKEQALQFDLTEDAKYFIEHFDSSTF